MPILFSVLLFCLSSPVAKSQTIRHVLPVDPKLEFALWNLHNYGQPFRIDDDKLGTPGKPGADIHILEAWKIQSSAPDVLVAVIDGGFDLEHPDLRQTFVRSKQYNFLTHSTEIPPPTDSLELHGNLVAGIIGANGFNSIGISGISRQSRIIPIEAIPDGDLEEKDHDVAEAILWAINQGARIINCSFGKASTSTEVEAAIRVAQQKDVLIVAGAGNGGKETEFWPASYSQIFDNVISVAATDRLDRLWSDSGFGKEVDIAAPGDEILSTGSTLFPNKEYVSRSGTSGAAPHVSAVASLMLQLDPAMHASEIKAVLLKSADRLRALKSKVKSGRLNAEAALKQTLEFRKSRSQSFCDYASARKVLNQQKDGHTAEWTISNSAELESSFLADDAVLSPYRRFLRRHLKTDARGLLWNYLKIVSEDELLTPQDDFNTNAILSGDLGIIRPMNCLESIPFREFLRMVDLKKNIIEFSVKIFMKDGIMKIVGDFYYSHSMGAGESSTLGKTSEELMSEGWVYLAHYHNHPPDFSNKTGDPGTLAPSDRDIKSYFTEMPEFAVITNGLETLELPKKDYLKLRLPPEKNEHGSP